MRGKQREESLGRSSNEGDEDGASKDEEKERKERGREDCVCVTLESTPFHPAPKRSGRKYNRSISI